MPKFEEFSALILNFNVIDKYNSWKAKTVSLPAVSKYKKFYIILGFIMVLL